MRLKPTVQAKIKKSVQVEDLHFQSNFCIMGLYYKPNNKDKSTTYLVLFLWYKKLSPSHKVQRAKGNFSLSAYKERHCSIISDIYKYNTYYIKSHLLSYPQTPHPLSFLSQLLLLSLLYAQFFGLRHSPSHP